MLTLVKIENHSQKEVGMGYQTEQKAALTAFLSAHRDRQFTAAEIAQELSTVASIGASTIYRLLGALVGEGSVRRFTVGGGRSFYYQYVGGECHFHLHLKCTACGKLFHLDGAVSHFLQKQILASNRFVLDEESTLLFGICESCKGGEA
jgi:Fur family ferric uptake transcriptional regulator